VLARENVESIAFYGGGASEKRALLQARGSTLCVGHACLWVQIRVHAAVRVSSWVLVRFCACLLACFCVFLCGFALAACEGQQVLKEGRMHPWRRRGIAAPAQAPLFPDFTPLPAPTPPPKTRARSACSAWWATTGLSWSAAATSTSSHPSTGGRACVVWVCVCVCLRARAAACTCGACLHPARSRHSQDIDQLHTRPGDEPISCHPALPPTPYHPPPLTPHRAAT
jgi:hypothetical protein